MDVRNYIRNKWKFSIRTHNKLGNYIPVPYPYNSPCTEGLFDELYYRDTYFLNRGLLQDKLFEQAKNNILDISYLISKYGFMPNAAREDMINRSQPPFFISMVIDYYKATNDKDIISETLSSMNQEIKFWLNNRSITIDGSILFQYRSHATDDFYINFAKEYKNRVLLLIDEEADDLIIGKNALAECESGRDFSSRFNQRILNHIPIDLNSIMYYNLKVVSQINKYFNIKIDFDYDEIANKILAFIRKNCYKNHIYYDYDFVEKKCSKVISMASFFPYKYGLSNSIEDYDFLYNQLLFEFGLSSTKDEEEINYQRGFPNMRPNLVLVAFDGANNIENHEKKLSSARFFTKVVENEFSINGKLWEKYDVNCGSKSKKNEYAETEMLGWTAGCYCVLYDYLKGENYGKN